MESTLKQPMSKEISKEIVIAAVAGRFCLLYMMSHLCLTTTNIQYTIQRVHNFVPSTNSVNTMTVVMFDCSTLCIIITMVKTKTDNFNQVKITYLASCLTKIHIPAELHI